MWEAGVINIRRLMSVVALAFVLLGGSITSAMQPSTLTGSRDEAQIEFQTSELESESTDVEAEGIRNRAREIQRKARECIEALSWEEIRRLPSSGVIKLKQDRDGKDDKDCKEDRDDKDGRDRKDDKDRKDERRCKRDKREVEQEQMVFCDVRLGNPHPSSTTGGATVNVHHAVKCPVYASYIALTGFMWRDLELVDSNSEDFFNITGGNQRDLYLNTACRAPHRYTAVASAYVEAPGYVQVEPELSAVTVELTNCDPPTGR